MFVAINGNKHSQHKSGDIVCVIVGHEVQRCL